MKKKVQKQQRAESPEQAIRHLKNRVLDRKDITSFLLRLAALLLLVWILFGVIFHIVPAAGNDMQPALKARDVQLVYSFPKDLWTNDLVVYNVDGTDRTGRIAARPGDVVEISNDRQLIVNGSVVSEPEIYYETPAYEGDVAYPLTLGQDEYFLLADFREGAKDSRNFGPISRARMKGKVILVLRRSGL